MTSTSDLAKSKRLNLLVCPQCGDNVRIGEHGFYYCPAGHQTTSLRDLAVKGEAP